MSHFIKFVTSNASVLVVKRNERNVSGFILHRIVSHCSLKMRNEKG